MDERSFEAICMKKYTAPPAAALCSDELCEMRDEAYDRVGVQKQVWDAKGRCEGKILDLVRSGFSQGGAAVRLDALAARLGLMSLDEEVDCRDAWGS